MERDMNKKGKILSVNVSEKKGEKKHDVGECMLVEDFGLAGDAHGGFQKRQVSLLAKKSIDKMRAAGIDVGHGDFAENLTTDGIELHTLPIGTKMRVGGNLLLRITQIGKVCHDRCTIFKQVGDCVMPREGIFAEVLTGGKIKIGDVIEII
jgi:MOSC domain-containing protein YiiM